MLDPLQSLENKEYIFIIGAGGKTTFAKYLRKLFLLQKNSNQKNWKTKNMKFILN